LAAVFVACFAIECFAETPEMSGNRPQALQLFQGRLFSGQSWWNRYGEPVNATELAQAETLPADKSMPAGPIAPYGDGYVYYPGVCDCPPPCISNLWNGYVQWPKRCNPYGGLHGRRNCNDGCGGACGACGNGGCGNGGGLMGGIFGHCGCNSCSSSVSCGCTTPVTCTTAAPDCGCKPSCGKCRSCHLGNHWRGFMAHWNGGCNSCSCSAPSCGCTTPVSPDFSSEKQASQGPPKPLPEEALLHPLPRLN
jgi:hypothetical protein